ncbi:unnamed protein product [Cuscuta epithymum]|uniref:RRM domain-containing protein n=1 Tax=Cuscuta epithymum TaxID=186058 RepID=A0AAV0EG90_9ASTE|nr:unnamed protein product [Cuscuta epithymum]
MGSGDDQAFRVNFSSEGVAKLREQVQLKLMEFMGDYTDDTLVEYVMVLLRNGRNKGEAKNELDVFLGDDSNSFVSWLWDHLGSNLNLYVQQQEPPPDVVAKIRPSSMEHAGNNEMHRMKSVSGQVKPDMPRSRHKREWKGLLRDTDEHPAVVVNTTYREVGNKLKLASAVRSASPEPEVQRKRSQPEDVPTKKRESISQANIAAPRRLLQFAVRDALATSRQSNLGSEPSLKRLRSVVSTPMGESSNEEHQHIIRSIARFPNPMDTATKAVAEAPKDVKKYRSSANVFDRLGSDPDMSRTRVQHELMEDIPEDEKYVDVAEVPIICHQRSDLNEQYADLNGIRVVGQGAMDVSHNRSYVGISSENSLLVEHIVGDSSDGIMHNKPLMDQDQPISTHSALRTGSLNVNTWKSAKYQEARNEIMVAKSNMPLMKESSFPVAVDNGNVKASADTEAAPQKIQPAIPGLYPTGTHTEDSDSRTIFVNNVHFAATKDSLSRHFNKFGEVLKVEILTDAGTGLAKGSAYVEFMRKESAEHALSLDGTSFMSRILKVVRKSYAPPEPAGSAMSSWPRIVRGTRFTASTFGRSPFLSRGGMHNAYRARLTVKPGARSMQWKRDAPAAPNQTSGNAIPSFTPRSMTYVRTEVKTIGSSDAAV